MRFLNKEIWLAAPARARSKSQSFRKDGDSSAECRDAVGKTLRDLLAAMEEEDVSDAERFDEGQAAMNDFRSSDNSVRKECDLPAPLRSLRSHPATLWESDSNKHVITDDDDLMLKPPSFANPQRSAEKGKTFHREWRAKRKSLTQCWLHCRQGFVSQSSVGSSANKPNSPLRISWAPMGGNCGCWALSSLANHRDALLRLNRGVWSQERFREEIAKELEASKDLWAKAAVKRCSLKGFDASKRATMARCSGMNGHWLGSGAGSGRSDSSFSLRLELWAAARIINTTIWAATCDAERGMLRAIGSFSPSEFSLESNGDLTQRRSLQAFCVDSDVALLNDPNTPHWEPLAPVSPEDSNSCEVNNIDASAVTDGERRGSNLAGAALDEEEGDMHLEDRKRARKAALHNRMRITAADDTMAGLFARLGKEEQEALRGSSKPKIQSTKPKSSSASNSPHPLPVKFLSAGVKLADERDAEIRAQSAAHALECQKASSSSDRAARVMESDSGKSRSAAQAKLPEMHGALPSVKVNGVSIMSAEEKIAIGDAIAAPTIPLEQAAFARSAWALARVTGFRRKGITFKDQKRAKASANASADAGMSMAFDWHQCAGAVWPGAAQHAAFKLQYGSSFHDEGSAFFPGLFAPAPQHHICSAPVSLLRWAKSCERQGPSSGELSAMGLAREKDSERLAAAKRALGVALSSADALQMGFKELIFWMELIASSYRSTQRMQSLKRSGALLRSRRRRSGISRSAT